MSKNSTLFGDWLPEQLNGIKIIPRKYIGKGRKKTIYAPNGLTVSEIWIDEIDFNALKSKEVNDFMAGIDNLKEWGAK